MSPTFLHLKWIVSFCFERAVITTPLFRYVYDSCTCVCVCVCTSHAGTPNSKTRAELIGAIVSRGVGNQTTRARFVRAIASNGGGEFGNDSGGVQKRAYLILAIASQFKGAPNANPREMDPRHCCAEGDTDKQNATN